MIMYFIATERPPFSNCAHDEFLVIDICKKGRPEIDETEAPKCYIDLMKRCWNSNPDKRPKATEICELIDLFHSSYIYDKLDFKRYVKIEKEQQHYEIEKQFKEAEEYRKISILFNDDNHDHDDDNSDDSSNNGGDRNKKDKNSNFLQNNQQLLIIVGLATLVIFYLYSQKQEKEPNYYDF